MGIDVAEILAAVSETMFIGRATELPLRATTCFPFPLLAMLLAKQWRISTIWKGVAGGTYVVDI